tara:strand:- start:21328 stop:22356 length:1029 start_codon:yes stop_codon:yes gene_type:complete
MKKINEDILSIAESWINQGREIAIATVISTWGSSPRPIGSQLLIDEIGEFEGSVSGGCVEGAVIDKAKSIIKTGLAEVIEFGVSNEEAWEVGLSCGGNIRILITAIKEEEIDVLVKLNSLRALESPIAECVDIHTGTRSLVNEEDEIFGDSIHLEVLKTAGKALNEKKSLLYKNNNTEIFIHIHSPPIHTVIIGATHITQILWQMLSLIGYKVSIVDPRKGFSSSDRFKEAQIYNDWPDDYLDKNPASSSTAIITLTHDPKIDDPALEIAILSSAFYIGALGSSRTHEKRVNRLIKKGLKEEDIGKIKSPIGLDIGSKSPSEIAASIVAEVIKYSHKRVNDK